MEKFKKLSICFCFIFCCIFLSSCTEKWEYDEEAPITSNVKPIIDDPNYRPEEDVPMPVLAQGKILVIRLVYAMNEKDENNDEWYQVELKRNDSKWHDLVKIQGIGRSKERHWDDYSFSANNFNWQIEEEHGYGTDTLDGVYTMTITGSNGFSESYQLNWKDGKWTNMSAARTFYVP